MCITNKGMLKSDIVEAWKRRQKKRRTRSVQYAGTKPG
jgi:hypothetical protein